MKQGLFVLGAALAVATPALAQDAVKADPKHYKVVAENERVRVLKATYAAGDKGAMHEHPDNFAVFMTDAKVRFGLPDGTAAPAEGKAGDVIVQTAVKHKPENLGGPLEVYVVEVKPGAKAPAPVAGAVPPPSGPGVTRTQIASGPHGEAVRLKTEGAFAEPDGSKHDYDAVVIPMSDSGATVTMNGKTMTEKKGEAILISRGTPHSVKTTGASDAIVVYVK